MKILHTSDRHLGHMLYTRAGRHVGIISHVEELQERIPVQIQVNQEGEQLMQ